MAPIRRRTAQTRDPRAEQAVANLKVVIEKAERTIGGQRRKPERQARQLDRHRIEIDTVQTAFSDQSTDCGSLARTEIAWMTLPVLDDGRFVGLAEIRAGCHQKSATAHRGIEHLHVENPLRRRISNERVKGLSNEIGRDWLWRIERAHRLANAGARLQRNNRVRATSARRSNSLDLWDVVEQRFVDGSKLFDAKIAISNPLATLSISRGPRRERNQRSPGRVVVQVASFRERSL